MIEAARSIFETRSFTQSDFDLFALMSGDDNPIHVDPTFCARTRFGRTVAHGMLLFTVLRGLVARLAPGAYLASQELTFPAPTYAGDPMHFLVKLHACEAEMNVSRVGDGLVTCVGKAVLRGTQT